MPNSSKSMENAKNYNKGRYKDKFREHQLTKVQCADCGRSVCRASMSKHKKSKLHIRFMEKMEVDNKEKELRDKIDELQKMLAKAKADAGL